MAKKTVKKTKMFKVGDKVLVNGVIVGVDEQDKEMPYHVDLGRGYFLWLYASAIHHK